MAMEAFFKGKKTLILFIFILVFFAGFKTADAANLYFSPSSGTYSADRNFTVNVMVNSSASMNAASGIVTFPASKLEVVGVSKTGSILNLWVQEPSFSNRDGNVRFEGIVLNPGFSGDGKLISVTFRVKSAGPADLSFSSGSVLTNDGLGTNILSDLGSANFSLEAGAVSAPEAIETPAGLPSKPFIKHLIQNKDGEIVLSRDSDSDEKWINSSYNKFTWELPKGVTGVSLLLNDRPSSNPGSKSDGFFDNKIYEKLDDGISYLHIRFINTVGAGPILHFKIMVDTIPPEPFDIVFPDGETTPNPAPRIKFETIDNLSGIDRYEIKIDNDDFVNVAQFKKVSYFLPRLVPGEHQILVRAYDKADNYAEAKTKIIIVPITSPIITEYPTNIISPGEKLVLKGTALSNATVEIYMNKRGKEPIIFNTQADEKGNWEAVYENVISSGAYEVWAKQILESGAESLPSQVIYIGVNSWFWRSWQWLKNVGGIVILTLILLAALASGVYYFWHCFRMWRIKLRREVREAENALEKGFKKLRAEIKKKKPTGKVLKDLSTIEKTIEKEIKDIEKKP